MSGRGRGEGGTIGLWQAGREKNMSLIIFFGSCRFWPRNVGRYGAYPFSCKFKILMNIRAIRISRGNASRTPLIGDRYVAFGSPVSHLATPVSYTHLTLPTIYSV